MGGKCTFVLRMIGVLYVLCRTYHELPYCIAKGFGASIEVAANKGRVDIIGQMESLDAF